MSTLDDAQNTDMFCTSISFGVEGVEVGFFYQDEQGERIAHAHNMIINCDTEEQQEIYLRLQENAQWLIDEALIEERDRKNK